jgi:DNA-binding phage protein
VIHVTIQPGERVPPEIVALIRAEYRPYHRTFGAKALAYKYGISRQKVWRALVETAQP